MHPPLSELTVLFEEEGNLCTSASFITHRAVSKGGGLVRIGAHERVVHTGSGDGSAASATALGDAVIG